jgi:hypothetical protein
MMQKNQSGVSEARKQPAVFIYKNHTGSDAEIFYQLLGFSESKQSIKQLGNINDAIPVLIVSSTGMEKAKPLKEDWYSSQKQWLNNNPNSKIVKVTSNHFIQLERPQLICEQIKKLIT